MKKELNEKELPDALWKEIVSEMLPDFIKFFMPELYDVIDFNRNFEFLEQELEKVKESNFKIVKKLAKYRSTEEKKQDDADIFIDLLKKSDRIPTVEALSNFTNNRISKSTWHRKLKNDAFLYILSQKITDLARKTKNKDRIDFYISVSSEFHDKFTHALAKKTKNEFIYEDRFKTRNLNHSYDMDMNNSENSKETLDIFDDEKDNSWLGNN